MSTETISVAEAAERAGISKDQITAAARRAAFRSWLSNRARRIHLESFNTWLAQRRAKDPQYGPGQAGA